MQCKRCEAKMLCYRVVNLKDDDAQNVKSHVVHYCAECGERKDYEDTK